MVAKNLRFRLIKFFQYRSALFTIAVLLLASCSGVARAPPPRLLKIRSLPQWVER